MKQEEREKEMVLIAKVAVAAAKYTIDKAYNYIVPKEYDAAIAVGMRVSVPFSRGNRRSEGIVLELSRENWQEENIKLVDRMLDEEALVTEEQIKLAKWMKVRFYCTIYEAIRAMLPAGLWFKREEYIEMAEGAEVWDLRGGEAGELLRELGESGKRLSVVKAVEKYGEGIRKRIKELESEGIIELRVEMQRKATEKSEGVAVLQITKEEALSISEGRRKSAPAQSEILKFMAGVREASIKDIMYYTGIKTQQSIKALERSKLLQIERRGLYRRPEYRSREGKEIVELSGEQEEIYRGLGELLESGKAEAALLYGVTGSGKTAVYIKLIGDTIRRGKKAITLVPEIALTPQLMSVFTGQFGERVAVLHSGLSIGERYDEWRRIKSGRVDVVVGTRSAVFAPIEGLGIIILDEEQETTYKSEVTPRYHAREIAKYLCVKNEALLVLGSATPAIDTMYSAKTGRYRLYRLDKRYNRKNLPAVIIADMRKEIKDGVSETVGKTLREEMEKNLSAGEQSILFINRRGTHNTIACPECGYVYSCPNCSVNMTYHGANKRLMCHYCGHKRDGERKCPECGGLLKFIGSGTQKVEEEVKRLYPGIGVLRMDTDTVSELHSHEEILERFEREGIPVLIGTQMVTKGLNFEKVTLVGVISADQALYSGDYRAQERTFGLITQVIGRSGRGEISGRAVIQTYTPENEVIRYAAAQDYDSFYEREIFMRKMLGSPPIAELYCVSATGINEESVIRCCGEIKSALEASIRGRQDVRVLGPAPATIVKVRNRFRYRVLVSSKASPEIRALIGAAVRRYSSDKRFRGIMITGDVNPAD